MKFVTVWIMLLLVMASFIFWTEVVGVIALVLLALATTGGMAWGLTHLEDDGW
jgi:hypothetical protein